MECFSFNQWYPKVKNQSFKSKFVQIPKHLLSSYFFVDGMEQPESIIPNDESISVLRSEINKIIEEFSPNGVFLKLNQKAATDGHWIVHGLQVCTSDEVFQLIKAS